MGPTEQIIAMLRERAAFYQHSADMFSERNNQIPADHPRAVTLVMMAVEEQRLANIMACIADTAERIGRGEQAQPRCGEE